MNKPDLDVILASLKLARAMRRCPPERGEAPFPPAVGRLLACAAENPGVSSRELCELLDIRPSSLSEMLSRAEADGLLTRAVDEEDRRIQHITLSAKGSKLISDLEAARDLDVQKKTACLTEEEKRQFVTLCNKLSEHIERLALDLPEDRRMPPPPPGPHHPFFKDKPEGEHPHFEGKPEDEAPRGPRPPFPKPERFRC
ncbi:MAG: MarR family transcriptional regulator [Clostridiales bacterium]|nr:MarR family transcriptional regulator [Clostridiales bacterium]